ncbi:MAG: MFS transporter, partial [Verrucomicrobiota bacterium]
MPEARSPFAYANIRWFIAFRVLFNARFYYPILTVFFLDMGLTLEQFFLLNAVWAVSIVGLEVPSGAFADTFGRQRLVFLASLCMVAEMALLAFLPMGDNTLVFWAILLNRVISGVAEAFASGADEALAFDTLKQHGQEEKWPQVLDILMRISSGGFLVAMLVGGAVYDAGLLNRILAFFGSDLVLSPETTLRFPIYLTLLNAAGAVIAASRLKEPTCAKEINDEPKSAGEAFAL